MGLTAFATVQAKTASAIAERAALDGSVLADLPVVLERFGVDSGQDVEPALNEKGAVLCISFPDSGGSVAVYGTSMYFVTVTGVLFINPTVLLSPTGLNVDPLAILDELTEAVSMSQQGRLGPHAMKSLDVPVERIDEAPGALIYVLQFTWPVVK